MIEALRIELSGLGAQVQVDGKPLDLDQLTRMARAARAYGLEQRDVSLKHGPSVSPLC